MAQSSHPVDSLNKIIHSNKSPLQLNTAKLELAKLYVQDNAYEALRLANEASHGFKAIHQNIYLADCYTIIGVSHQNLSEYDLAIYNYLFALKLVEKENNLLQLNEIKIKLGVCYMSLEKYDLALNYLKEAKLYFTKTSNNQQLARVYNNLGLIYQGKQLLDSSLMYHQQSLDLKKMNRDKIGMAKSYNNIGNVYHLENKYTEALSSYSLSLQLAQELNDEKQLFDGYYNIAICYYGFNDLKSASIFSQRALELSKQIDDMNCSKDIYFLMSEVFETSGKYKEALFYFTKGDSIEGIIFSEENNKSILELETKYQTEKKEKEIKVKSLKVENQQLEIRKKQFIIYGFIVVVIIIVFLGLFILKEYKQKKKAYSIIESQKHLVEEKNKEITDSINYAKHIQNALLPNQALLSHNLSTSHFFVHYKPKDIVSGDFYWSAEVTNILGQNLSYMAVCDSTGHGVPGAFMSILSMGFLNEAIKEKRLLQPGEAFDYVRQCLINHIGANGRQDGFDGILFCVNKTTGETHYAAANNKPLILREGIVNVLECDKMPVGEGRKADNFRTFSFTKQAGDRLFLSTDGYVDQFGGPKGKKFMQKQLSAILQQGAVKPLIEQHKDIDEAMINWQGNSEQVDDILVIGIQL